MALGDKNSNGAKCTGGRSFGCKHEEHPIGKVKNIFCRLCNARMGCSSCCQRPDELVCLNCHDWAHIRGLQRHGKMIARDKVYPVVKDLLDNLPF